ncbi:DEAD/DEAH box helicase [Salinigranum marinum]|uniref:DEAD/DEAH box helicase n=1 Tax=Salinigranum marinum TaxID=1515595 RepID=UPI00298A0403|nr:DEAD/DEAH box helicase [Salinigranum marinum]
MSTVLNPFEALEQVQSSYQSYVETFQNVDDSIIESWIEDRVRTGKVLWKEPFVQLNQRFEHGDTLEQFVADGELHEGVLDIFTGREGKPIEPYKHQTEAIHSIQAGNNTIVSTGTGSGKSFAFGIPIVSHCLEAQERGEDGVKAVIVYPMNALANSQYEDFAERLDGTGLRLGLYTGDTPHNPDSEAEFLRQFGREEAYDSEVVSREEMQNDPPDILMTNYVMLDLILTRHDDKKLFPEMHEGALQYLVLDEIHTYTGQQGADVAALIRRLKQNTGSIGDLTCIGTSATVQSEEGIDANEEIADFTGRMFGAPVDSENVVRESHYPLGLTADEELPPTVKVTASDIEGFSGTLDSALDLTEKLLDRSLIPAETEDEESLGSVLAGHPAIEFLDTELSNQSQQIFAGDEAGEVEDLVARYQKEHRPDESREAIERELQAALLVGTVGTTAVQGEQQPIFVPKLHSFFSQGSGLVACISEDAFDSETPHLSDAGDVECRVCAEEEDRRRDAYPLSFCRGCGQEFYTVTIDEDGHVSQGTLSNFVDTEEDERAVYLMQGDWDSDGTSLPDEWLTEEGLLKDTYREAEPSKATYFPDNNRLTQGRPEEGQFEDGMFAGQGVDVTIVESPFLFCPNCGVHYTRRVKNEFNKLFTFGTVGRSTATDVLVGNTMRNLPEDQQKTIAFSDNRQDTALQAAHLNNLYQRVRFRRALYTALREHRGSIGLTSLGDRIFDVLEDYDSLPPAIDTGMFGPSADQRERYSNYLLFNAILELGRGQQRTQQSLEDVGLLDIEYENLDRLAQHDEVWEGISKLETADPAVREEYVHGVLDIFRRSNAVDHESTLTYTNFRREVISKLDDEVHFHGQEYFNFPVGYSDTANTDGPNRVRRLTHPRSRHVKWTTRALNVDTDTAAEIITAVVDVISDKEILKLLNQHSLQYTGKVYMLNHSAVRVTEADSSDVRVCPKCGTPTTRSELNVCLNYSCGSMTPEETELEHSYFYDLYTETFDEAVDILAGEHSGQVEGEQRKELESKFREGEDINTIVCTPTMELGIDIGDLSNVYMRNVPPNPSNYAQRSGRAGRQNQPSLVTTFCGRGFGRGSHDQYFYRHPERIISGKINPPTFLLNNQDLIVSHINALILETVNLKLFGAPEQILSIEPEDNNYEVKPDYRADLQREVDTNRSEIIQAVKDAFARERENTEVGEWLTDDFIEDRVNEFVENFDSAFDPWRREYTRLWRERRRLNNLLGTESGSYQDKRERDAIEERLNDMRAGDKSFYTYQYLRSQGFLPNYGFPRHSTTLTFTSREDDIQRDQTRAIKEFAPGNHVYYDGERFAVRYARPRTENAEPVTKHMRICSECEAILMGDEAREAAACVACGSSFDGTHSNPDAMEFPDQHARPEEYITSDEEERRRQGYNIDSYYEQTDRVEEYSLTGSDGLEARVTYEANANIVIVNSGLRDSDDDGLNGFALCMECNRWLTSEDQIEKHVGDEGNCYANATSEVIRRDIELYTEGGHDTITLTSPLPAGIDHDRTEEFYTTLKESVYQGILRAFDLDEEELETFVKPATDHGLLTIVIYETSEGGAGALHSLMEEARMRQAFREAQTVLHGDPDDEGCERACYECLLSFYNQMEHELLDRTLVGSWLESMTVADLEAVATEPAVEKDFDALLAACDSGFEREVLQEIRDGGFELPDAAQHTIYDGDEPVAKPDFFYERSGSSIAVFVDGPDHQKDYVKEDDDKKRNRLRQMGFRVIAVTSTEDVAKNWDSI